MSKTLASFLFCIYLFASLIRWVTPSNIFLTSLITIIGIVLLFINLKTSRLNLPFLYLLMMIIFLLLSSVAVYRYDRLGHTILFVLMNGGVALTLNKNLVQTWAVKIVFYYWSIFFLYQIFIGADPDAVMKVVSHNGVSMMMLVTCISYYIVVHQNASKLPVWPAFLTFIISIWGIGRMGILSSFIIFVGVLFVKFKARRVSAIFVGLTIIAILNFYEKILEFGSSFSFSRGSILNIVVKSEGDEPRFEIWSNYLKNLDTFRLIFGANVKTDPWPDGAELAYNYHNTFINLHSQTGLMGILTLFILLLALFRLFWYDKIYFILFAALFTRWFTDIGLYFESWDFLPFFFTFITFFKLNVMKDNIAEKPTLG